ncbi:MAG: putative lipid II flippase FtsW [Alkalispirochaetaceae bacterium]
MIRHDFGAERIETGKGDTLLLLAMFLLSGVGLAILFSSSYFRAEKLFDQPMHFFRRQAAWIALGSVAAFLASRIPLKALRSSLPGILAVTLSLMVMTFLPGVSAEYLGARRWIFLFGYSFQPSELTKFTLILYLAYILDKKSENIDDPVNALLPPLIVVAIFTTLIYLQNDFSTAFFVMVVSLFMFFVAGVPWRYFISLFAAVIPISLIMLLSREHRVKRILSFIEPRLDPTGTGYQVLASQNALARGGLWGTGIGQGTQKLGVLPEAHSDFIFAVLGEELGFFGIFLVMALFGLLAYRGFRTALVCEERFASFLTFGLTVTIAFQALLNMAVVSGMVPATGVTLPFFSSGGSSLFITLVMCGVIYNVSRRLPESEGSPWQS